jgi:hypothetical protein
MTGVRKCLVEADAILRKATVTLVMESGDHVQMPPSLEKKTA